MARLSRSAAAAIAALFLAVGTIIPVVTVPAAHAASVIAIPAVA
ncbi:hypothetical protein [Croceibacterium aestuarii]|nr:hypothetical protein [Croceibacterium sp. D39]